MKQSFVVFLFIMFCSFQSPVSLKGTWEFAGGIYNGKKEGAPAEYALHRKYDEIRYVALVVENGYKPEEYENGYYYIKGDTCVDTETFCAQPSKITNIPIRYIMSLHHDTLTFSGTLPTGMVVEEYWKKIR